jgi:hypothetical protein
LITQKDKKIKAYPKPISKLLKAKGLKNNVAFCGNKIVLFLNTIFLKHEQER